MGLLSSLGRRALRGGRGMVDNIRGNIYDGAGSAALVGGGVGGLMSAANGGSPEQIAQDALMSGAMMGGGQLVGGMAGGMAGMAGAAGLPFAGGADSVAQAVLQAAQRVEDIPQLVAQAAQSRGIDPQAVMQSIQRMLQGG